MLNFELNIQQDSLEKIKVFFQKLRMLSKKLHQIQYPNSTEFLCAINHICAALTNLNLEHLAQTQPNLENLLVNIKKQKLVLADLNKKIAQVEQQQAQSFFSKFFGLFKEKDALLQVRHNMKQQLAQEIEKRETELSHQLLSIIFNETNQSLDKLFPFYVNSIMAPLEQNQQLANSLDMNLLSILLLVKKQFFYFFTFAQTLQGTMQTVDLIKNVPYFAWTSVDTNHRSYLKRGFDFFMEQSPISSATSAMADWFFLSFDAFLENFDFFYINMYSHKMIPIELQKNVHTSLTEFYISQNFSFLYPLAPIIMEVVDKISEENEQIMPKDALELFSKLGLLAFSPNNFTQPNTVIILQLYESIKTKLPDCYFKNSLEYKTKFFTIFIKFSKNILATLDHPLVKEIWDKKKVEQLANAIHVAKNMNLHHEADIQEGMKLLYRALYQLQHTHKEESNQLVPYVTNLLQYSIYELNTIFYSNSALEFNPNFPEAVVNILFELGIRKLNALINTNMDLITKINHSMEEEKTIVYAQPFFQQTSQAVRNIDKILFLYSTGGSGHEQAMRAHVQIEKEKEQNLSINYQPLKIDLMKDFLSAIGEYAVDAWNNAQKSGDIQKQEELVSQQAYANYALGPIIFFKLYQLLKDNPQIETIINTQAMCTPQICQAVLRINQEEKRNIKIRLIMTDLPTPRAVHFWNGIKTLSPVCRHLITLESLRPLTAISDEAFFTRFCGIGLDHNYTKAPIRKGFLPGNSRTRDQILADGTLEVSWQYADERAALVSNSLAGSYIQLNDASQKARIRLKPNEHVITIMLGSQGGDAIISYVHQIITLYHQFKNQNLNVPDCMFIVYCGTNKNESSQLFKNIYKLLKEKLRTREVGEKLRVFPLGFQNSDVNIAEIAKAASLSIIRTGGLATMEMLQCFESVKASNPEAAMEIFIHSEAKDTKNVEDMLKQIPVWERGNAEYLIHSTKAKVLNLDTVGAHFVQYLTNIYNKAHDTQQQHFDAQSLNALPNALTQNNNSLHLTLPLSAFDNTPSKDKRSSNNAGWSKKASDGYKKIKL